MSSFNVTEIEIEFSNGSFADWANGVDEQSPEDVSRWEAAYNKEIIEKVSDSYPHAKVSVVESDDILVATKVFTKIVESDDDPDYKNIETCDADFVIDDYVKVVVDDILAEIVNAGKFWEA